MPTNTKRRPLRRSNKVSKMDFPRTPNTQSVSYSGRIPTNTAEQGIVAVLRGTSLFATGAGTSFVSVLDNNPSSLDNWAEYSDSWSSYRILGVRLEYAPTFDVNTTSITGAPLIHSVVHAASITSPTSNSTAFSQGDAKLGHVFKKYVREWRMSSVQEAAWVNTNAPSATSLCFVSSAFGLTTATTYGTAFTTYLVQFRTSSI